jgi:hypothetical protein
MSTTRLKVIITIVLRSHVLRNVMLDEVPVLDIDRLVEAEGTPSPSRPSPGWPLAGELPRRVGRDDEEEDVGDDRDGEEEHHRPEQPSDQVAGHRLVVGVVI